MKYLLIILFTTSLNAQTLQFKSGGVFPNVSHKSTVTSFYEFICYYKYVGIEYSSGKMTGYDNFRYKHPSYGTNYQTLGLNLRIPTYQFNLAFNPYVILSGGYMRVNTTNYTNNRYKFDCKYVAAELLNKTIINDRLSVVIGLKWYFTETKYLDSYYIDGKNDKLMTINVGIEFNL